MIIEGSEESYEKRGSLVKCGATIRLLHSQTKKYLASNDHFESPLSSAQEVCCSSLTTSEHKEKAGDWQIVCSVKTKSNDKGATTYLSRNMPFRLKHVTSGNYLSIMQDKSYPQPIQGQKEIVGLPKTSDKNIWTAREGVYFAAVDDVSHADP